MCVPFQHTGSYSRAFFSTLFSSFLFHTLFSSSRAVTHWPIFNLTVWNSFLVSFSVYSRDRRYRWTWKGLRRRGKTHLTRTIMRQQLKSTDCCDYSLPGEDWISCSSPVPSSSFRMWLEISVTMPFSSSSPLVPWCWHQPHTGVKRSERALAGANDLATSHFHGGSKRRGGVDHSKRDSFLSFSSCYRRSLCCLLAKTRRWPTGWRGGVDDHLANGRWMGGT